MKTARAIAALFCVLALGVPDASRAGDAKPLGVVELFTSQGCNSCPPADAFFNELAAQDGVIALAYHVDYWDYLGWRDTLARPQNTERQYAYMKALGGRDVYTPQVIVNGREPLKGSDRQRIRQDLAAQASRGDGMAVELSATENGDSITIRVGPGASAKEANLVLVFYAPPQSIAIDRGENNGRTATYLNAVKDIRVAGVWHGKPAEYELPKSEFNGKGGCVALLQSLAGDGGPGPILGAAIIRRP